MPLINLQVSAGLSPEDKDNITKELGQLISLMPGRSEKYLMVSIKDDYTFYLAGAKLERAAFIDLRLLGRESEDGQEKFVVAAQASLSKLLDIPIGNIYTNILEMPHWGARGIYETSGFS
jgi:phenylpyruvate tautomerase PptA (4-oxalocrotonate tautomerase family)